MKFDTIIIGGGLSGLTCGISLAEKGQKCAIISTGQSALHFCSGSFDLLGYVNGFDVETPASTLGKVIPQGHPYSIIGAKNTIDLANTVPSFFERIGIKVNGSAERNHYRVTPMGIMKPTWLSLNDFTVITAKNKLPWSKISIQNISGFLDFHTSFVADNFEKMDIECTVSAFTLPEFDKIRTNPSEMRSANIAKVFENEDAVRRAAEIINRNAGDAEAVALPAVFGLYSDKAVEVLKASVKLPICFIPVIPPSVPGIRTQILMRKRFQQLGGTYLLGDSVNGATVKDGKVLSVTTNNLVETKLEADNFILATGSFFSHGIEALPDKVVEPVFGLDVNASGDRDDWFNHNLFNEQPFMSFGVKTDNQLHALIDGKPVENLYAVGAVLTSFNAVKEASGAGVSIITALYVANNISKSSK